MMTSIIQNCGCRVLNGYEFYPCSRKGKLYEEGKWWCTQHAPSTIQAKRERREARWTAEADTRRLERQRQAAMRAVCDGIPTEALESKQTLYIYLQDHHELRTES